MSVKPRIMTCANCGEPGSRFLTDEEVENNGYDTNYKYLLVRTFRKDGDVYICEPCLRISEPIVKRLRK